MKKKSENQQRFTLIELLIVVSIIAILAALLLPALATAKGIAKRTVCFSNLKQVGLGALGYVNDYNEFIPPNGNPTWLYNTYKCDTWNSYLLGGAYVNEEICFCPFAPPEKYENKYTYGWSGRSMASLRYFIKISKLDAPARPENYIFCADSSYATYSTFKQFWYFYYAPLGTAPNEGCIFLRHSNRANTVFADGHVSSMSREELVDNPYTWYDNYKGAKCSVIVRGTKGF